MKEQGQFQVGWDEKEGMIRLVTMGKIDADVTERIVEELAKILDSRDGKANLFADLSGQTGFPSIAGRKLSAQLLKHPNLDKTAAVITSVAIKVATGFIVRAAGYENIKMCTTEEQALKWLKEGV